MTCLLILPLILCAALPAAEGKIHHKDHHKEPRVVLGRQAVDAGHVLEARAVAGQPGLVLIRWGDVDKVIAKDAGKGSSFAWTGNATGTSVSLVKTVAFEDCSRAKMPAVKTGKRPGDHLTGSGAGSVSWETRTAGAWDGVVVRAASGSALAITCGPASFSVAVP